MGLPEELLLSEGEGLVGRERWLVRLRMMQYVHQSRARSQPEHACANQRESAGRHRRPSRPARPLALLFSLR
eukprot:scaffold223440_cov37-Tisochrysis_lutea.AAC.4